jgi:hypothetical protein
MSLKVWGKEKAVEEESSDSEKNEGEKRILGNQEMMERTTVIGISQNFINKPATHSRTKKNCAFVDSVDKIYKASLFATAMV